MDALLARHLPGLRAFVRLRVGKLIRARESCSDLVQSVAREALQDLGAGFEYRGEKAFRQWLYKLGLRKILDRSDFYNAAKRAADREVDSDGVPDEGRAGLGEAYASIATPSRVAMAAEERERLEQAMDQLPDDYREAITLHRLVGMSHGEIAESMGRSEGAVRNLVYRGMARLAVMLDEEG